MMMWRVANNRQNTSRPLFLSPERCIYNIHAYANWTTALLGSTPDVCWFILWCTNTSHIAALWDIVNLDCMHYMSTCLICFPPSMRMSNYCNYSVTKISIKMSPSKHKQFGFGSYILYTQLSTYYIKTTRMSAATVVMLSTFGWRIVLHGTYA